MKTDSAQVGPNADFKVCTSCGQRKDIHEFHRFGKDGNRIGKWCEPCLQRQKRRRAANQAQ
jgi:hypothetical protein